MMDGFAALYLFMLAGIAGYVLIARVPSILHTPLMSGSNFIHGVVLAGAMVALGHAEGLFQQSFAFVSVVLASANVVGGYVVTDKMLSLFAESTRRANDKAATRHSTAVEAVALSESSAEPVVYDKRTESTPGSPQNQQPPEHKGSDS